LQQGIHARTLDNTLTITQPLDSVLVKDRAQPEFTLSYLQYRSKLVSPERVRQGRLFLKQHRALLRSISARYGVPESVIIALWGIESSFGRDQGQQLIIPALATLAYDGRRGAYFRGELLSALQMIDQGMAPAGGLRGSWAGAMGQCQFMPSTYLRHARSWRGGVPGDIWSRLDDVFASTAGYLADSGWQRGVTWGLNVTLPHGAAPHWFGPMGRRPASAWKKLGLRPTAGSLWPDPTTPLTLITADGVTPTGPYAGPVLLVSENFKVLMTWNRSIRFAGSVGTLADAVGRH